MKRFGPILVAAFAVCACGGARAQTPLSGQSIDPRLAPTGATVTPASDLPAPRASFPLRYAPAETAALRGFAKTAIDHRFAANAQASVTGSVGYLCGLRPSPNETNGPVSSYDSVGTFLGAKVSYAF